MSFTIRRIQKEDNPAVKKLIIKVLLEHGAQGEGFASGDPELDFMFENYQNPKSAFWVVEQSGKIAGVGGVGQLKGEEPQYCELQKMYFLKELRGKGAGFKLISMCLDFAKQQEYTYCYLETLHNMEAAQKLYKKFKFTYINTRLGGTGHTSCPVFMILNLTDNRTTKF